jgi:hypothetical protein
MADVGRNGILEDIEPVLRDGVFNGIQPGLSRDEVLRMIGPPSATMSFPRSGTLPGITNTRHLRLSGDLLRHFDSDGSVVSKISQRLERGDGRR